ncbi:endo-14-beta-xylanase z precursor-like protein [Leptomonas pyrrhocoris]|uniref:Endo-14-beta-xylanase z-like protein n=1 Tax=Leptomonas pyrrhocoris TaxID=157538 RepID=A0A0N0DRW9_LEPPY|nr:endo-14-beta-xylanase z precursor-like protein [Leptomonas pyrrhocoris]KPA75262.1 endo-14-beta-xylanase z precursor-like protein [Leptomonas pyrrhocoris]|eukprot:XP_015653701.1 endo-14-beta-xylanase z precursor-like protein [Leptomonas pyrrhocoris]
MSTATINPAPLQTAPWTSPTQAPHLASHQSPPAVPPSPAFPLRDEEGVTYVGDAAGTVHYHFYFPKASFVSVVPSSTTTLEGDVDEARTTVHPAVALKKQMGGAWWGEAAYSVGLHKVFLLVDGRAVLTPHLPVTCERNEELVNYIDVPPPDESNNYYLMRPRTEHGSVAQEYITSYTTDTVEEVLVYLPPSYHKPSSATRRYPVLYLLHDDRNHGMGSLQHGKVNIIADNLIADGKMTDMIIVMKNNANGLYADPLTHDITQMCDDLTEDIIPYIDNRYRTLADRDHRAIAGLSMGSMHASRLSITRPDLFAYAGIFSGFMRTLWSDISTNDDHMDVLRRDPAAYQSAMKVLFRCIGDEDEFISRFEEDDAILAELGVKCTRRIYKGPHSWHVWRQAGSDFLTMIFK